MKRVLVLSDCANGRPEDQILVESFSQLGAVAEIGDWKSAKYADPEFLGSIDFVLNRTTWDYTNRFEEYMAKLSVLSRSSELVNSLEAISWSANKRYLAGASDYDIRGIRSDFVPEYSAKAILDLCEQYDDRYFVIKPIVGAGGRGVVKFRRDEIGVIDLSDTFKNGFGAILQPYRPEFGRHGEWSLIYVSQRLLFSVLKTNATADFRIQRQYGGLERIEKPSSEITALGQEVIQHMIPRCCLYARIDILATASLPMLVEVELVEPRLFFDLVPSASLDLAQGVLSLA